MCGQNLNYIIAMLNSKLGEWLFNQIGTTTGVGTNRWKKYKLEEFYIKNPTNDENIIINKYINQILLKNINHDSIIDKLDDYIYTIYNLSSDEIHFINKN